MKIPARVNVPVDAQIDEAGMSNAILEYMELRFPSQWEKLKTSRAVKLSITQIGVYRIELDLELMHGLDLEFIALITSARHFADMALALRKKQCKTSETN